jgi:hypothetical protein
MFLLARYTDNAPSRATDRPTRRGRVDTLVYERMVQIAQNAATRGIAICVCTTAAARSANTV